MLTAACVCPVADTDQKLDRGKIHLLIAHDLTNPILHRTLLLSVVLKLGLGMPIFSRDPERRSMECTHRPPRNALETRIV